MAREPIGATELLAMINEKMEWMNACRNLHVTCIGIDPKRTDGCNWQVAGIRECRQRFVGRLGSRERDRATLVFDAIKRVN